MNNRRIPTKQELLQLQKLYRTDKKIGQALGGVSEQLVAYWRRKKGVGKSVFPKYSLMEIKELWERYGDDYKGGAELQITKQAFYRWRKKYKLLERPTILKLEQLEFKFFDEQRLNRGAGGDIPAQTYFQKIASYHADNRFIPINESVEVSPDFTVSVDDSGFSLHSGNDVKRFHSVEEMFDDGYFQPGRIILSDTPEASVLAVTTSLVQISPPDKSASTTTGDLINLTMVPAVRLLLTGTQQIKHTPFDCACCIMEALGNGSPNDYCLQLGGGGIERLTLDERMSLLAYTRLLTGRHVVLEPDQTFLNYLSHYGANRFPVPFSDKHVYYLNDLSVTVARTRSLIYSLGSGKFVQDFITLQDRKLRRVRIGPVLGGTLEDFRVISSSLKEGSLKSGVELYLFPRSRAVFLEALRRKYVQKIVESGGFVGNYTAQPRMPILKENDIELTTEINRNSKETYLTSVQTMAIALAAGRISKRLFEAAPKN